MERAGLAPRIGWIAADGDNFDAGVRSAEWLLERREGCTAIVACDDLVMLGVLDTLRRRGIAVPAEMSLLGFGDTQEIRSQQTPTLSTIRAPRFQIGEQMVALLLSRLADPRLPPRSVTLPTELILRESCGPVADEVVADP